MRNAGKKIAPSTIAPKFSVSDANELSALCKDTVICLMTPAEFANALTAVKHGILIFIPHNFVPFNFI